MEFWGDWKVIKHPVQEISGGGKAATIQFSETVETNSFGSQPATIKDSKSVHLFNRDDVQKVASFRKEKGRPIPPALIEEAMEYLAKYNGKGDGGRYAVAP